MDRWTFVARLAGLLATQATHDAHAQQTPGMWRIGIVTVNAAADPERAVPKISRVASISHDSAKALGLAIPPSLLQRADEVIQ